MSRELNLDALEDLARRAETDITACARFTTTFDPAGVLQLISMARRATHASQQGEEDAARLDWLEASSRTFCGNKDYIGFRMIGSSIYHGTLREAIDAARAAHPGREEGGKA